MALSLSLLSADCKAHCHSHAAAEWCIAVAGNAFVFICFLQTFAAHRWKAARSRNTKATRHAAQPPREPCGGERDACASAPARRSAQRAPRRLLSEKPAEKAAEKAAAPEAKPGWWSSAEFWGGSARSRAGA